MAEPVIIIGAGPAGLVAAYQLVKKQIPVLVLEASDSVGGMAKSISLWGRNVDIGPHRFFSYDKKINELWLEIAENQYQMVNRITRIYYQKKFFDYPLKPFNALFNLGILEATKCFFAYLKAPKYPNHQKLNFEQWVHQRFGKHLYEIFFKTYTEKLWGIPCNELDSDFASQRIKKLSLGEAVKNAFFKKQNHQTLLDVFAYPNEGSGQIYLNLEKKITESGMGKIWKNSPVQNIEVQNQTVTGVRLASRKFLSTSHVISSMPINLLVKTLPDAPETVKNAANELKFRNTILVYLLVNRREVFQDQWIYVHDSGLRLGRITNFNNWVEKGHEKTILCLEFWCNFEDEEWQWSDAQWQWLAISEMTQTNLVQKEEIENAFVYKIPRCYPVYNMNYQEKLQPIIDYLKKIQNLQLIGRYGSFKYNNQDHSFLMGMLAAENFLGANHDLWAINTDYEYQEKVLITETGLQIQSD